MFASSSTSSSSLSWIQTPRVTINNNHRHDSPLKHINSWKWFRHSFSRSRISNVSFPLQLALPEEDFSSTSPSDNRIQEDDDGWGISTRKEEKTSSFTKTTVSLTSKRRTLQEDSAIQSDPGTTNTKNRDLFVPIFALISLLALFGTYGYEMLRLYARGELYLPWEH